MSKLKQVLKKIFIIITSPIWFPWKILFFRKEGHKFQEVDDKTKAFRIIRSPLTKPIKLLIFFFILSLEITCVYKVRYSVITYPLTRLFVHNYYIDNETSSEKLLGIKNVNARGLDSYKEDLEIAFNYIDNWDLNSKNKMYAVFNSEFMKVFFENAQPNVINHLITRFNNEENYREGIHKLVKNINKLLPQTAKELTAGGNSEIAEAIGSLTSVSLYAIDFNVLLDILGLYARLDGDHDFSMFSINFVDALFEIGKRYGEGNSLLITFEDVCSVYRCGW